jgi:hypothetical protein
MLQKSFWGGDRNFLKLLTRGPYHFIQNRSRTSAMALKSDPAAARSKDQPWRDFLGRSISNYCNNIRQERSFVGGQHWAAMSCDVIETQRKDIEHTAKQIDMCS